MEIISIGKFCGTSTKSKSMPECNFAFELCQVRPTLACITKNSISKRENLNHEIEYECQYEKVECSNLGKKFLDPNVDRIMDVVVGEVLQDFQ